MSEQHDPVGGYIQGFGSGFVNQPGSRPLDFTGMDLDAERAAYFRRYLDDYYNSAFIYGQGTEHILAMAARHAPGGHWLDIGSGTSALFWATAFRGVESVTCADLVPEALFVFDRFRASGAVPACYLEALKIAGNTVETLVQTRSVPWEYHQCNILRPWAPCFQGRSFDMITAYAVFGLAPDLAGYKACFRHLAEAAAPGQTVLGADWVRSDSFVAQEGHDNRYVSVQTCQEAAREAGFSVTECAYYPIQGDPLYAGVVPWALKAGG